MKLIIGGAYQGKLRYAQETYHAFDGWIDGNICQWKELESCTGIYNLHELIRRIQRISFVEEHMADQEAAGDRADAELSENEKLPLWMEGLQADNPLELEQQAERFVAELLKRNPEILIVSNELGCGIVPLERKDRTWRETVGRVCTCLAAQAEEVIRVICGIGMKIK